MQNKIKSYLITKKDYTIRDVKIVSYTIPDIKQNKIIIPKDQIKLSKVG